MIEAAKIIDYMKSQGFEVSESPGHLNIVYIEGMNIDGTLNKDQFDRWNDLRAVIVVDEQGRPTFRHLSVATTEPGRRPTFSAKALKRGGVFRIMFGQWRKCWRLGHHKNSKQHPALVQIPGAVIMGHRDRNRDGFRTGDLIMPGFGINQHGTKPGFMGKLVDYFSEGCLVGKRWEDHLRFIEVVKRDARYIADPYFSFDTTIISGINLYPASQGIAQKPAPPTIQPKKPINTP
mgnify:FL=1